jgi:beta-xylosidase
VIKYKKPNVGKNYPIKVFPVTDEFNTSILGMQWGWNHNPDQAKWSLTERPGYLRLKTVRVDSNFRKARNTLTQRPFASYDNSPTGGITKMEVTNMKDGDIAGLAVFQDSFAFIGVAQTNGSRKIIMVNNGETIDAVKMNNNTIYLRTIASNSTEKARFEYSVDNKTFTKLGNELSMKFNLSVFTGNKFCLFNYATKSTGGYVDFDWFRTKFE